MVIRFKLLVKNTDAVPKLRITNVFKAVEGLLVSVESFINIVAEEVAVANR